MATRRWRVGVAAALVIAAGGWAVSIAWSSGRLPMAAPIVVNRAFVERPDTVRRNETLSQIFAHHNIGAAEMLQILHVADGLNPRNIRPGRVLTFRYVIGDSTPDKISTRLNDDLILTLVRQADSTWKAVPITVDWSVQMERAEGVIHSSLDVAVKRAIPDSVLSAGEKTQLVWDLADDVFAWELDFTRDIYDGDRFDVLYERLVSSLGEVRYGRILAAKIESRGVVTDAYVMTGPRGGNLYYDHSGRSLRRAFKRYPVKYAHISSGFSHSRLEPILDVRRPHLGVDYAAPTGTPIEATGDGVVTRAGRWGGYGIIVVLRHPKGIQTRYAHMSRIARGIHPGVHVKQGQIIGYVGMTGLATGPHVHYEFRKNGVALNPRSVNLGDGTPIAAAKRAEFDSVRDTYNRYLGSFPPAATGAVATAAAGGE